MLDKVSLYGSPSSFSILLIVVHKDPLNEEVVGADRPIEKLLILMLLN